MMSLTFGLFTQVSGSGPLGPLVIEKFGYCYLCVSPVTPFLSGALFNSTFSLG